MAGTGVLCCPVIPHPAAMDALEKYAPDADIIPLDGDDTFGYWREIKARWTGKRDLILIEQDNEIREDTIRSLERCPEPWCVFAYPIFRDKVRLKLGLGCTKVSASAQRLATADLIERGFWLCAVCKGKGCWWHLDGRITEVLRGRGYAPHVHGDITHHHDYGNTDPHQRGVWEIPFFADSASGIASPPRRVVHNVSWDFAETPDLANVRANQLYEMASRIAADPSELEPPGNDRSLVEPAMIAGPAAPFSTDKIAHGYMPAYHRIVATLGPAARVCEVGVFYGGSLATWQVLFPDGLIAGVDSSPNALWPEDTQKILCSQDDATLPDLLREHSTEWDLIIDDASHNGKLTARTLELLWPLVAPGGYYVIEDWFVGFSNYPGYDTSMADLARNLLEQFSSENGSDTDSIEYRYGMVIMRKKT